MLRLQRHAPTTRITRNARLQRTMPANIVPLPPRTHLTPSNPRVIRQRRRRGRKRSGNPLVPAATQRSSHLRSWACFRPHGSSIFLALENLQGEARRGVLSDVAVHEPRAWIVGLESDDDEAASGHQHDIAPRRVEPVHSDVGWGVDGVFGLLEDGKVVAV